MRRVRKFLALDTRDKLQFVRCLPVVALVRLGLTLLSYRTLSRWIPGDAGGNPPTTETLRRLAASVRRAARLVPGATCLTQALAAQFLLARSGHRSMVRVGVAKDSDGRLLAHAWLISDDRIVVGGSSRDLLRYTPIADLDLGGK